MTQHKNQHTMINPFGTWTESVLSELERQQDQAVGRAGAAIDELSRWARDAVALSHQFSREWLKAVRGVMR